MSIFNFLKKHRGKSDLRCSVRILSQSLELLLANVALEHVQIVGAYVEPYKKASDIPSLLLNLVESYDLKEIDTYWLLEPENYQLNIIDGLPVESKELNDALMWRIRGLITDPIEEVTIDSFILPGKPSSNMAIAASVVSKTSFLKKRINAFKAAGLNLINIGIPELAMRNLTSLFEEDENKCSAFLYFYPDTVIFNISKGKMLYLTRRIAPPKKEDTTLEKMSTGILRIFDYLQTQWRLNTPENIFIATGDEQNQQNYATLLAEHLQLKVDPFPLTFPLWSNGKENTIQNPNLTEPFLLNMGNIITPGESVLEINGKKQESGESND